MQEEHTAEDGAMNTVRRQDRRYQNARSVIYTYSYSYTYMFHSMSLAMVNSKDKLESNRAHALTIVSLSTRACVCHQKLDSGYSPPHTNKDTIPLATNTPEIPSQYSFSSPH